MGKKIILKKKEEKCGLVGARDGKWEKRCLMRNVDDASGCH